MFYTGCVLLCLLVHTLIDTVGIPIATSRLVQTGLRAKFLRQGIETTEDPVQKNCICSQIYDPVCASNNQSYNNLCLMECQNKPGTVSMVHEGKCIPFRRYIAFRKYLH
ncbi:unnamed protein product [Leptidea sinapis]|uniref:Kazal-like domain-containing protein n=1 Tax=Leptidea sinapis TaxID=189913 RepID=A0A5E4R6M6_9NEOP|nr:unnamed protein product [Leptidea sinapis]